MQEAYQDVDQDVDQGYFALTKLINLQSRNRPVGYNQMIFHKTKWDYCFNINLFDISINPLFTAC